MDGISAVHRLWMTVSIIVISLSAPVAWGQQSRIDQGRAAMVQSGLASHLHLRGKVKKDDKSVMVLRLFPNPASQQIHISLSKITNQAEMSTEGFDLEIHSKSGSRVLSQKWSGEKVDVSVFPSGIYIVTLRKGQQYYSQKLVVQRE
jgi:hypothetical protein